MARRKLLPPPFPPENFTVEEIRELIGDLKRVAARIEGPRQSTKTPRPLREKKPRPATRTVTGRVAFIKAPKNAR